jgi:predicted Fe-Mo cluster-binding NifX family protein
MKIAVPTTQSNIVDAHFGHCEFYTVFTVDNSEIINSEIVESPQGCGCKSNIVSILKEMGVEVMLAGNMGGGAVNVLNSNGISVYRGCDGDVKNLVEEFIKGELIDSGESCHQHEQHNRHEDGHQCDHHN